MEFRVPHPAAGRGDPLDRGDRRVCLIYWFSSGIAAGRARRPAPGPPARGAAGDVRSGGLRLDGRGPLSLCPAQQPAGPRPGGRAQRGRRKGVWHAQHSRLPAAAAFRPVGPAAYSVGRREPGGASWPRRGRPRRRTCSVGSIGLPARSWDLAVQTPERRSLPVLPDLTRNLARRGASQ